MKKRAIKALVPTVLCAAALAAFALAGCRRGEGDAAGRSSPPKADPPSVYMKDPAFREALSGQRRERNGLAATRSALEAKMVAKVEAAKARLGTGDTAAVKAELEKDPEWRSLYDRMVDVNKAIDDNRRRTGAIVRNRVAPENRAVSK